MRGSTYWGFYYCSYILRTKEVYNQRYYHLDGCKVHRNSKQVPYKKSGYNKMTRSIYEFCNTYAKKHRVKEYYHQKKLAKIVSIQILIGNLEVKNTTW